MILPRYKYDAYGNVIKEHTALERIGSWEGATLDEVLHLLLDEIEKKKDTSMNLGEMIT